MLTFAKNANCPRKTFRSPGAVTREAGKIGLGENFSTTIRRIKNIPQVQNKAGLFASNVGLPSVVARTNAVVEVTKAASPK